MRKNLTVTVQIQFDQYGDEDSVEYAGKMLNEMSHTLNDLFDDISPVIFTNAIDKSDVLIEDDPDMYLDEEE